MEDKLKEAIAVAAGATTIVSGDDHLLALKKHQQIEIVTVAEFVARIRRG